MADAPLVLLPLLRVAGRPAVVVGAGAAAAEAARGLLQMGAIVTVITPNPGPELRALISDGAIRHLAREFSARDLSGATLAIAADEPMVSGLVHAAARAAALPFADANDPAAGELELLPAAALGPASLAARAPAPALARELAKRAGAQAGPGAAAFHELFARLTATLLAGGDPDHQARIGQSLLDSDVQSLLEKGETAKAEALALRIVGQTTRALR